MLDKAKISKYKLKKIIKYFCVDIEASKTAILTKINRNTVNRWFMIFRKVIYLERTNQREQFTGNIEVDESYFGSRRIRGKSKKLKRGRGTFKQPVFGVFERNGGVYTEIIPNCRKKTLQALILAKVSLESVIHSDGWRGYDGLVDVGYDKHLRVRHGKNEFSNKKGCHINGIESFWSFTKRRFTNLNSVHKKYFDLHLKECEWRWKKDYESLEKELYSLLKTYSDSDLYTGLLV